MPNGNTAARQDLHATIFRLHEILDRLEEDGELTEMDFLLAGAEALFQSAETRFEQLRYCLSIYGRPTPPAAISLSSAPKVAA